MAVAAHGGAGAASALAPERYFLARTADGTSRRNAMLVLSRKAGEAIVIAGKVRVVVAGVRGATVRLGVQAPRDVPVDREEVHLQKKGPSRGPPRCSPSRSTTCWPTMWAASRRRSVGGSCT